MSFVRGSSISLLLAGSILAVAAVTGSLWHELPPATAARGSFGWPALAAGRWWTLVTSLVLTRDPFMALTMPLAVAAALGAYERRAGHGRALAVAAVSHATGSVLVALGAGALGRTGWPVAVRAAENLDYGASMVVAGALGALASRHRRLVRFVATGVVLALVAHHQLADWAHLMAAPAGYVADRIRRPRRALVALTGTAVLTAWLVVYGWVAVVDATDAVRFGSAAHPAVPVAPAHGSKLVRLEYRSPALGGRVMLAWVYVPAVGDRRLPVALFLHGIPGAPDDWLAGGDLTRLLDQAVVEGRLPPVLGVIPDGEGMHDPSAGWNDVPRQRLVTSVSSDLLGAVAGRWPAELGQGQVAVIGVGKGGAGAARLSQSDTRVGYVAALDPPASLPLRPGVHSLIEHSGPEPHGSWKRWRAELPGVLDWLAAEGFGRTPAGR